MSVSSVVGIDVAKAHVDIFVLGAEFKPQRFVNEAEGHSDLATALAPLGVQLVVMTLLVRICVSSPRSRSATAWSSNSFSVSQRDSHCSRRAKLLRQAPC